MLLQITSAKQCTALELWRHPPKLLQSQICRCIAQSVNDIIKHSHTPYSWTDFCMCRHSAVILQPLDWDISSSSACAITSQYTRQPLGFILLASSCRIGRRAGSKGRWRRSLRTARAMCTTARLTRTSNARASSRILSLGFRLFCTCAFSLETWCSLTGALCHLCSEGALPLDFLQYWNFDILGEIPEQHRAVLRGVHAWDLRPSSWKERESGSQ